MTRTPRHRTRPRPRTTTAERSTAPDRAERRAPGRRADHAVRRRRPGAGGAGPRLSCRAERRRQVDSAAPAGWPDRARRRRALGQTRRAHRARGAGADHHRRDPARLCHRRRRRAARGGIGADDLRPRSRSSDARPVRRRRPARRPGPRHRGKAGRAPARRADQPSRHPGHRDLGGRAARQPRGPADGQPRPRLPAPHHQALLLAGGPPGLAARQGLRRIRRLVGEDQRRTVGKPAPAGKGHRAGDLLVPPLHHRPAHAKRGPRPGAERNAPAQGCADGRCQPRHGHDHRGRPEFRGAGDRSAQPGQILWRADADQALLDPHPARRPRRHRRPERRRQDHSGQDAVRRGRAGFRLGEAGLQPGGRLSGPGARPVEPRSHALGDARPGRRRSGHGAGPAAPHHQLRPRLPVPGAAVAPAGAQPVRRRAQPADAGPRPGPAGQSAGARRAHQRPRHGDARPLAGAPQRL